MAVKYAVIGAGAIAQRRHLPEGHANPHSKIVAIADPVESRVQTIAAEYDAEAYTDHKKMLKQSDCDAVVVAGPNKFHARHTIEALEAGKHVLCEKPMATRAADAKKMIEAAKTAGKYLMIGMNQRLMPPHIRAKELLQEGRLGKPLAFQTLFKHAGPEGWSIDGRSSWFFDESVAIMGVTGDLGVHKADLMRWLLGQEFTHVGGVITTLHKKNPDGKLIGLDDNAMLQLKTDGGVCGTIEVSWTNYGSEQNDTTVYCENGVMRIGADPTYGIIVDYANGDREMHKVGEMATNVKQVASGVIDAFTDAIRKRRKPEIDGDEGFRCLNVILTAMQAAKKGRTAEIKY